MKKVACVRSILEYGGEGFDVSDVIMAAQVLPAYVRQRDARIAELEAAAQICLVCGAESPCMNEEDLNPDDPGVPCTFECQLDIRRAIERGRLIQRATTAEAACLEKDIMIITLKGCLEGKTHKEAAFEAALKEAQTMEAMLAAITTGELK